MVWERNVSWLKENNKDRCTERAASRHRDLEVPFGGTPVVDGDYFLYMVEIVIVGFSLEAASCTTNRTIHLYLP
jgi:hypothetical protein